MPPYMYMMCFDKGTRAAAPGAAAAKCSQFESTTLEEELARLGGDGDSDGDEGGGEGGGGGVKDGDADAGGVSASAPAVDADAAASSDPAAAAVTAAAAASSAAAAVRRNRRRNSATGALGNSAGFNGLVFDNQTKWADLIPKVVWQGG